MPFSANVRIEAIVDNMNSCIVCIARVIDEFFVNVSLYFMLFKSGYLCECIFLAFRVFLCLIVMQTYTR